MISAWQLIHLIMYLWYAHYFSTCTLVFIYLHVLLPIFFIVPFWHAWAQVLRWQSVSCHLRSSPQRHVAGLEGHASCGDASPRSCCPLAERCGKQLRQQQSLGRYAPLQMICFPVRSLLYSAVRYESTVGISCLGTSSASVIVVSSSYGGKMRETFWASVGSG